MRSRLFKIGCCLAIGLVATALGQTEPKEPFVNLHRIIDSGNCSEIDDMLARSDSKASLLASKGECHFKLGQLPQARESLLASLDDPSINIATFYKAHGLLYQMKLHEDGVRTASDFIARKQFLFEAYNRRSIVYTALGKYDLAVEDMILAAKAAGGRQPIDIGSLIALAKLPPEDERRPILYRRIYSELKPLVDSAVKQRDSIPPNAFTSPGILNTINDVGRILRVAANYEAEMYDARGLVDEREGAFDKMVTIEPRFLSYGMRAAFYKQKGLPDRAKECTRLMYFYLTDESTREIKLLTASRYASAPTQALLDRDRKRLANQFLTRGKHYHLSSHPELAKADLDKALELDPELQARIDSILAEEP